MPRFISVAAKLGGLGNPLVADAPGHRVQSCGKRSRIRYDRGLTPPPGAAQHRPTDRRSAGDGDG
jgi:hypothetical protein